MVYFYLVDQLCHSASTDNRSPNQMTSPSLHSSFDSAKSPLKTALFLWIGFSLISLSCRSILAQRADHLSPTNTTSNHSVQNFDLTDTTHNCACGMACKTRCCCAGKPVEAQSSQDNDIPPELRTKSKSDCGCQMSPSGNLPVPFRNQESGNSGIQSSQNACLSIISLWSFDQGESKFLAVIDQWIQSNFEAPPDPPPPAFLFI